MGKRKILCGIYKIENKINGKIYIGQSTDIKIRWCCHKSEFRHGNHANPHFQRAWDKYGEKNFKFDILVECKEEDLNELEIYYIDLYKSNNPKYGYNCGNGGKVNKKINEETRQYLCLKRKEYFQSIEIAPNAKLSKVGVLEIKALLFKGDMTDEEISNIYNVHTSVITKIRTGETYRNIKTPYDDIIKNKLSIKGEKYGRKLNESQVIEIKKLLITNKLTQVEIANIYNVRREIIVNIKTLKKWTNIGEEYNDILKNQDNKNGSNNYHSLINEQVVIEIKEKLHDGMSSIDIAREYNISKGLVQDIKKGRAWKQVITPYDEEIKNIKSNKQYNKNHKFDSDNIYEIKRLFAEENKTITSIAELFKCGWETIHKILYDNINSYKDIKTPYDEQVKEKLKTLKCKLTEDDVKEIKRLINEGHSNKELSDKYNIDSRVISSIRHNKAWKNVAF